MLSLKNLIFPAFFLFLLSCNKSTNTDDENNNYNYNDSIKPITGPTVIIGTSGDFFAIDEATGEVRWRDSFNSYNTFLSKGIDRFYTGIWDTAHAFNDSTGKIVWSFGPPNQIDNTLLTDNKLMVTDFNGGLFALDAATGKPLWKDSAGPWASISAAGKMLLASSNDNNFYAYNVSNGNLLWKYYSSPGNQIPRSFVAGSGEVFAQTFNYKFYALDSATGLLNWTFGADSAICDPLLIDNAICTASTDKHFYALDRATGATHWTYSDGDSVYFYIAAFINGSVFIEGSNQTLYCLNETTGSLKWKYATNDYLDVKPTLYNGIIYLRNRGAKIYALNVANGAVAWSIDMPTQSNVPITFVDGNMYVAGSDMKLYNLDPATGATRWSIYLGGYINSVPFSL